MHNASMVALQVRNVPEEVHAALVEAARRRGQSMQAYVLDVLAAEAQWQSNVAILDSVRDGLAESPPLPADSDEPWSLRVIREEREARDDVLEQRTRRDRY